MSASSDLRPRPALPNRVPRVPRFLVVSVSALLAAVALSDLFAVYAGVRMYTLINGEERFAFASQRELRSADTLYETAGTFQVSTYFACSIVFIIWFHWVRRDAGVLGPDKFRNGPGWAIGSWFIPLAQFWMPYRIAVDMWGASTRLPSDGETQKVSLWPVNLWWGLFISSVLFNRYTGQRYAKAETLEEIRDAVLQVIVADSLDILAAAAAVHFAVQLTGMQRLKATEGPYASALGKSE
ncbi:hypothetical protein ADL00_10695 [Streptomyces sp. AS58]|uniref:DUF4328 domain-containing protein n=1 Tax=Streptomyces sp. AS58 TaxID=1519489 RepID=UPI0006AE0E05|nr:DUF4328 domain-containing protein [Streptomyces sp. AS58]KOV69653.1 hypothetical protein ADL00_10695 [Streptomyces sp. AS58]